MSNKEQAWFAWPLRLRDSVDSLCRNASLRSATGNVNRGQAQVGGPRSRPLTLSRVQAQPLCSLGLCVPSSSKGLILPSWVACEDEDWFLAGLLSEPGGAVAAVVTRYIP